MLGALLPSVAAAAPIITLEVLGGTGAVTMNPMGTGVPGTDINGAPIVTWTLDAPAMIDGISVDSWSATLKEDPYVTNNLVVTNPTVATQTFVATVLLPIPAFAYDEVVFSSFGVSVTDSNGDGILTFGKSGATPNYQGLVNTTTLELALDTLPGSPLTLADCTPFVSAGCTATSSNGVASQAAGPGVATNIGITLTFTLSPGDSAALTSRFEIVPEPGTLLLGATSLLGAWAVRRKRA